jgi:PAS domain S-box-containing protein
VAGLGADTPVSPDDNPELDRFAQRVRDAEARRGALVADAGHELKTPLSIMLGLSGRLLASPEVTPAQERDLKRIRGNAYGLLKHVDDLLQAARMDSGRVTVDATDCDVAWLVREAATGFSSLLEERDQRLVLRTPGRMPARVDDVKLLTVVTNLIANAVRYAPRGGIVRCSLAAQDGRLRLEVADSGPGVPRADRKAVFERFHQLGGTAHRRPGGSGLGLAIVRELVTLLGGTVHIDDAPEGGAMFVVELAHEPPAAADGSGPQPALDVAEHERAAIEALRVDLRARDRRTGAQPRASAEERPRLLLVEQRETLGAYLEELLGEDYDVRLATTAEDAAATAATTAIDAIVVDVGGAGGEAALDALRGPALDGVPVVVLAADPAHAQALVRGTVDDYAVLPFAETLLVRLDAVVGRRRAETARDAADARFRAVFEQAPGGMALASPEGRLLEVNAAFARLLELPRDALTGLTLDAISHPDDVLSGEDRLAPPAHEDADVRLARRLVAADGRVVSAQLSVSSIRQDGDLREIVIRIEDAARSEGAVAMDGQLLRRVLDAQLARCARYEERAALLLVELDDLDGDDAGARRRALAGVAGAVRRRLRRSDVLVAAGDGRLAAIVVNAGAEQAAAVADDVRDAARGVAGAAGRPVGAAVGVRAFDATATAAQIVVDAEAAVACARAGNGVASAPG